MDCFANNGMRSFDIAHANVLVECRTRRPAGKEADLLVIFINSIATTAYTAFNHLDADELAFGALLFDFEQGLAPDKLILVEFHGPAKVGLKGIGLIIEFVTVEAITGL